MTQHNVAIIITDHLSDVTGYSNSVMRQKCMMVEKMEVHQVIHETKIYQEIHETQIFQVYMQEHS